MLGLKNATTPYIIAPAANRCIYEARTLAEDAFLQGIFTSDDFSPDPRIIRMVYPAGAVISTGGDIFFLNHGAVCQLGIKPHQFHQECYLYLRNLQKINALAECHRAFTIYTHCKNGRNPVHKKTLGVIMLRGSYCNLCGKCGPP